MWRVLISRSAKQTFNIVDKSPVALINLKSSLVLSERYQSTQKPVLPKFEKPVEIPSEKIINELNTGKKAKYFRLFSVFASGIVDYLSISYYLEYKKRFKEQNCNKIDYSSPNLPGLIAPSKSVSKCTESCSNINQN